MNTPDREAARMLRDLRERIGNLEARGRQTGAPTIVRTHQDSTADDDAVDRVLSQTLAAGRWNVTNYKTSTWGAYNR